MGEGGGGAGGCRRKPIFGDCVSRGRLCDLEGDNPHLSLVSLHSIAKLWRDDGLVMLQCHT